VRDTLRFEAVFSSDPGATARIEAAAAALGWTAVGDPVGRRFIRSGTSLEVPLELRVGEGWSTFSTSLPAATIDKPHWEAVEDLLIGLCAGVAARLGRSLDRNGFPRIEPWELSGGVDALDAVTWFGPALVALHGLEKRRLDAGRRQSVEGGLWLRLLSDPLDDPGPAADRAAERLSLRLRARPPEVVAAIESARQAMAARAPILEGDTAMMLRAIRATLDKERILDLERLLAAASASAVRDRVVRHLHSCMIRYGVPAAGAAIPVVTDAVPELLSKAPEDVVESAIRTIAWRDADTPAVEAAVVLEHWLANADDAPGILRMVLEADDVDFVRGMIAIDLIDVQRCPCERCADRRRRLAGP